MSSSCCRFTIHQSLTGNIRHICCGRLPQRRFGHLWHLGLLWCRGTNIWGESFVWSSAKTIGSGSLYLHSFAIISWEWGKYTVGVNFTTNFSTIRLENKHCPINQTEVIWHCIALVVLTCKVYCPRFHPHDSKFFRINHSQTRSLLQCTN